MSVATRGRGFHDLTREVQAAVRASGIATGLCTVFLHHTSASLLLCENADPDVQRDLEAFFARLVKDGDPLFRHDAEGPDDMPSHVRAVLTGNSLGLPVREGRCDLGTWQGVYLWEHRTAAHRRRVSVTVTG
nr:MULTISPECIES: secondary thiamine-phosphate synthase enzyme YjbQ [Myxococcaceae]